jgi:hypothetical protein
MGRVKKNRFIAGQTKRQFNQNAKRFLQNVEGRTASESLPMSPSCISPNPVYQSYVLDEEIFAQQIDIEFDMDSYLFDTIDPEELLQFDDNNFLEKLVDKLEEGLRHIFEKHRISIAARNDILVLLKQNGHPNLPSTSRTLYGGLSKENIAIRKMFPGEYGHFGIESYIKNCKLPSLKKKSEITLDFSIDGLPLVKSSKLCLWPILGSIVGEINVKPFLIGAYVGYGSFKNPNAYFEDFIEEVRRLKATGIEIDSETVKPFNIRALIGDSPGRALAVCCKYPTSFNGCTKCEQVGTRIVNTNVFSNKIGEPRTDESFHFRTDIPHHHRDFVESGSTALEKIEFGMVTQVPIDVMHNVDLGVTKRVLNLIISNKYKAYLHDNMLISEMEQVFLSYKCFVPTEFQRYPRPFSELPRYKATEYRQMLLYTLPVLLKKYLPEAQYRHFMLLSCAIRLLHFANDDVTLVNMARDWLTIYVDTFSLYHDPINLTYNVHNLLHLADCVDQFGNLSNFSMYKYENTMQDLKKCIKKPSLILQQLKNCIDNGRFDLGEKVIYKETSKKLCLENFNLDLGQKNNHVLLKNGMVVEIINFDKSQDKTLVHGNAYIDKRNFYDDPCSSDDIFSVTYVETKDEDVITFSMECIESKLFRLPFENGYVVQPLLHF